MKLWGPFLCLITVLALPASAQRKYAANSVLSAGTWYKLGIKQEGIYKVDASLLLAAGITSASTASASIRLYGNGGGMIDENNATDRPDDLFENPIEVMDGGDGVFSGADYFLFYAPGPHKWLKDSASQGFSHQKNLYADTAYYYITIGGNGKRIAVQPASPTANTMVNSYNGRYFYENDLVNFLNSGKQWFGEEFSTNLGGNTTRSFTVDWSANQPVNIATSFASRGVGASAVFGVKVNNQAVQTVNLAAVSGNILDPFATVAEQRSSFVTNQNSLAISFTYTPNSIASQGWLNWFEIAGRRDLSFTANTQLSFRDWQSVAPNAVANFSINNNGTALTVWEITDPLQPAKILASNTATQTSFTNPANRLREYIAFGNTGLLTPFVIGKIANQNLHNSSYADLIIITHQSLLAEAQRLATFHEKHDGYKIVTVTTEQVYQEFSGGQADPGALRDFVKMYFDKAGADLSKRPKYLLLFGSASYDYRYRITGNTHLVPGYESINSTEPLLTFTSDDFFGLLEDADDINLNDPNSTIDIGIGRIPARNLAEAKTLVDKIIRYHDPVSLGDWRNQSVYVADDRDANLHLTDAEIVSANAEAINPVLNQSKIYLDAFPVVSSSAGARYPLVNDAIVNQVFKGTLMLNYSGHGSYQRLADEAILTQEELNRFNNADKLPLFITASCDFAPHDDPAKNSLGAGILTGSENGAIALLTTTRLVFAFSNRIINDNYLQIALKPLPSGRYLTLGESVQQTKNYTSRTTGDLLNNRKFTLLGDPAMRLAFPELRLEITGMNGNAITGTDTLRALQKYTFTGRVTDAAGNPVTNFNGTIQPTVYDKAQTVKTLGNDIASPVTSFTQQANVLYKGNATVTNGLFNFSFIVPKDINYQPGKARISLYAQDGTRDANGMNASFYIGGVAAAINNDITGPLIQPFLNDDQFQNGGLTNENPLLLVKLFDSSGISTSGNGIGHDITAVIDGDERNTLVLNNFYTASQDSYQRGEVRIPLSTLTEGKHFIRIKAWDVVNNSSEATLDFIVVKQQKLNITHVRNFPNPFAVTTTFAFEHNQPSTDLDVTILVYNSTGALVRKLKQVVNTGGSRNCQIKWGGDSQSGAKLAKGNYIYKIIVVAGDLKTEDTQQLILF